MLKYVMMASLMLGFSFAQAKKEDKKVQREPASASCFSKGDQDGYNRALSDFRKASGKTAGCTRLIAEPLTVNCNNSGDYQAGFRAGYTETMMNNIESIETNACR